MSDRLTIDVEDILGNAEVRELAGSITRHTLIRWREGDFPAPVRTLQSGELWDATEVRQWLRANRKLKRR